MNPPIQDSLSRPLHDLRISVTDRCNFRCGYCMPKDKFGRDHQFLKRDQLLTFEEIEKVARAFVHLGVRKIRLTGGEPLIRQDLETLIRMLSKIEQLEDLSLTTNASLLSAQRAIDLRKAGITRVNVSLDALDEDTFAKMNQVDFPVSKVLAGIRHLIDADMTQIKINMVVQKGLNEDQILPLVNYFRDEFDGTKCILRFIEYMDVGNVNGWQRDQVFSAKQIHTLIHEQFPLISLEENHPGEVAQRWQYVDGAGELGIISSITQPFCNDCSRARLSAVGEVYHCLFASKGLPLIHALRGGGENKKGGGMSHSDLIQLIKSAWQKRDDQYSMLRVSKSKPKQVKVEMSYIGG